LEHGEPLFELLLARMRSRFGSSPLGKQQTVEALAPTVRLYESAARQVVVGRIASALGLSVGVVSEWVGRARAPAVEHAGDAVRQQPVWRGSKALNQLYCLLIHHHDLVAPEILKEDPDPDLITNYSPAQVAFALLLKGDSVTEVMDFVGDPSVSKVLAVAASKDSLFSADKAANAAMQILDALQLERIERDLQSLDREIDSCNIDADKSSYFSLVNKRQALQQRKNAIKTRFAR